MFALLAREDAMLGRNSFLVSAAAVVFTGFSGTALAQTASLSGTVTDPTMAPVPGAQVSLLSEATGVALKMATPGDGLFNFPNLAPGPYQLRVSAPGFREFVRTGLLLTISEKARVDIPLQIGVTEQVVEVRADVPLLNFENAELKAGIDPQTMKELPLLVSGSVRNVLRFVLLLPGVSAAGTPSPGEARMSGSQQRESEAILDGATLVQGAMGGGGVAQAGSDIQMSPDMVSEVKVMTANYEPQYGTAAGGVFIATTKSGTMQFHGSAYEYHRNTVLNARQFGAARRPFDLEHDFGGSVSGPVKVPLAWSANRKTFFFFNMERFRIRGGVTAPTLSIPSLQERAGDFSDWRDSSGNLIPIYDPATTRANPAYDPGRPVSASNLPYLRDQFMGCNGNTPNVICPSDPRLQNSLAKGWLQFMPEPTSTGPLNNFRVPAAVPWSATSRLNFYAAKIDHHFRDNDHFAFTYYHRGNVPTSYTQLPAQLATEALVSTDVNVLRLGWDKIFRPTLVNRLVIGYLNFTERDWDVNSAYVNELPKIPGVASYRSPSQLQFSDGFAMIGSIYGAKDDYLTWRPSRTVNDLMTWVRGAHTFKFGGEVRWLQLNTISNLNAAGTFGFGRLATGLTGINSGSPIASWLLGAVNTASVAWRALPDIYIRQRAGILHFGDTWKASPKLSVSYGLRWEMYTPTWEKYDRTSFLDPAGMNPAAGGRPGRLAFAGGKWGSATFGRRYPEDLYWRAFAPRLGIAWALQPKTVLRTGYGIFFSAMNYPNWGGGLTADGFNATVSYSSSLGGIEPAFDLQQGAPQNFQRPPFLDAGYRNGFSTNYRASDSNRLPYAQQWNFHLERELTPNLFASAGYVGSKGTRLYSRMLPINALDPQYLSMGQTLFDQFRAGDTAVGGVPSPYPGWREQMLGCAPTVAQALLPYPQYCSRFFGAAENAGNSTYHSLQLKVERRFAQGLWLLGSYTLAKVLTDSDTIQSVALGTWSGSLATSIFSPYQRERNKSLATDDIPHLLSIAAVYELPLGKGKPFLNSSSVVDKLLGGWQISGVYRYSSGTPFYFRSGTCNIPAQFGMTCVPGILPGADPLAQDLSSFDPTKPLFNRAAFEPVTSFNFYPGAGPRVENIRGFSYKNQDLALVKNIRFAERVKVQLRGEFFNVFNSHYFSTAGTYSNMFAFTNDVASPNFGRWTGNVTRPRNIQVGARIDF
jgi:hypothetical protein